MRHQFAPRRFELDTWRTDVGGSDFALLTTGPAESPLENGVFNPQEAFQQRHMVHCSALGLALDNDELEGQLLLPPGNGCELRLAAHPWPPPTDDPLLADLHADVLRHMAPAAQAAGARPALVWLAAVPDEGSLAEMADNLQAFAAAQLEAAAAALPAQAPALGSFVGGSSTAAAHPSLRHPSWPSDGALPWELVATHAAAAAGASPPFAGDSPGGPLQCELGLADVAERYAAARGAPPEAVQLLALGTRQFREKRQHALVMALEGDGGLGSVFDAPLQHVQQYNLEQQQEAGEVVAQPDSDGRGLTWWLQSSMAPVAEDQEAMQPWKTVLNIDPAAKGAAALTAAAHSFGNAKWDALDVALYFPPEALAAGAAELQVPVRRVRLRRAAPLRPTDTGAVPRRETARAPTADAVRRLAVAGVPLVTAPELVAWLRECAEEDVLEALASAGALRGKASPQKALSP